MAGGVALSLKNSLSLFLGATRKRNGKSLRNIVGNCIYCIRSLVVDSMSFNTLFLSLGDGRK